MNHEKTRILIADDDEAARDLIQRLLDRELIQLKLKVEIELAESIATAKKKVITGVDLIILDWHFDDDPAEPYDSAAAGEQNGKSFLQWLQESHHDTEAIMLTAYGSDQFARDVAEYGAYAYADKADVLGDANERQADGTISCGVHSRTFLFHIRNCIKRLQMRRRKDRLIEAIRIEEAIHRNRADLVALAAHDARSPLNQIRLALSNCALYLNQVPCDYKKVKELLANAIQRVDAAEESVTNSLRLASQEADTEGEYERVDLAALLDSVAIQLTTNVLTNYIVIIDADLKNSNAEAYVNPESLSLVVRELINNAAAAAQGAGKLTISWRGIDEKGVLYIDFSDDGPGVLKELETRVFDPLTSSRRDGGFGLHKCRLLMRLHGGELDLFKNSTSGATFRLSLKAPKRD